MEIVVVFHSAGYQAQVVGAALKYGNGRSIDEAVGDLVRTHPNLFGITDIRIGEKRNDSYPHIPY